MRRTWRLRGERIKADRCAKSDDHPRGFPELRAVSLRLAKHVAQVQGNRAPQRA